jgi:hypothetical protein
LHRSSQNAFSLAAVFSSGQTSSQKLWHFPCSDSSMFGDLSDVTPKIGIGNRTGAAVIERTPPLPQHIGSAVWLGDTGYLATCEHVVRNVRAPLAIGIAYEPFVSGNPSIVVGNSTRIINVVVIASNSDTDVTILRAPDKPSRIYGQLVVGITSETPQSPTAAQGAILDTGYPSPGESLFVSGYPLGGHVLVPQPGIATGLGFRDSSVSPSGL